jgi:manganese/zinc/iron transport system permease protein
MTGSGTNATLADIAAIGLGSPLVRVLTFQDYNTRIVVIGTMILGMASGIIGTFLLLRKRALLGDALSHATLPGIAAAFLVMAAAGGSGKWLPGLLLGATVTGLIGMGFVLGIPRVTRLKEDAALGIVLSVFFGLGIAMLGFVQKMDTGHAAGLESFIYGKTASMLAFDATIIAVAASVIVVACALLFKELTLLCFDPDYAVSQGWPALWLDVALMLMVTGVTVIGLQAVGLILMVALLVIPAASARFWTHHMFRTVVISAAIGGLSGMTGAMLSAIFPGLPAGAVIVVVAGGVFAVSLVAGTKRGLLVRFVQYDRLTRKVARQNLLRSMFEWCERARPDVAQAAGADAAPCRIPFDGLLRARSWSARALRGHLRRACNEGLVAGGPDETHWLTHAGWLAARQVVRNHRLWELYLITHADVATSHVDRDADQVEHVLGAELVEKLESLLRSQHPHLVVPQQPHAMPDVAQASGEGTPT